MAKCPKILIVIASLMLCVGVVVSCTSSEADNTTKNVNVKEGVMINKGNGNDSTKMLGNWLYRTVNNNLTDIPVYYAECKSKTAKHIQDDQQLDMQLTIKLCRRTGYPDEVVLTGNHGVFNLSTNRAMVQVRFDDGPVENFHCSVSEEYLSNGLLIDDASRFIARVRQADSCRISASYIHNGDLIFTHDLKGLEW